MATKIAISNFRKNCMGTMSFDGQFKGMRKMQEFVVYPIKAGDSPKSIIIQSDTRIGEIFLSDGMVKLSPGISSGAYMHHLSLAKEALLLSGDELLLLTANVLSTASASAGTRGVTCDNSGAIELFSS